MDDLDDLLEQPKALVLVTPRQAVVSVASLREAAQALVAGLAANRIRMTDPQMRADLVALHEELAEAIQPLQLAKTTVERVFLMYAVDAQAKEVPIPGMGAVHYEAPRGEYIVQAKALRTALFEIHHLDGAPTVEEIDEALRVEEAPVKPNNTRLNALQKKYGGQVKEAIDQHRQFVAPPAENGRVRFPKAAR